jgi:hypothetical protein
MTKTDFEESLNAVLLEHLEETVTAAELVSLKKAIIARIELDWDPFESADPLELGEDGEALEEGSEPDEEEDLDED